MYESICCTILQVRSCSNKGVCVVVVVVVVVVDVGPWCNTHLWQVYSQKILHVLFIQSTVKCNNIHTSTHSRFKLLSYINRQPLMI